MDIEHPHIRRRRSVRERVTSRRARRTNLPFATTARTAEASVLITGTPRWARQRRPEVPVTANNWRARAELWIRDAWWYALHRPYVARAIGIGLVALFALFVVSHLVTGRLFPNVWALGTHLGDLTVEEAAAKLEQTWRTSLRLQLTAGERSWSVKPDELGLILDSHKTAERARAVGMAGLPFGYSVEPVVDVDLFVAQNYLLNLTEEANYAAYNAGYRWEGDRLVGVEGRPGAVLDVGSTVERLRENAAAVAATGTLELVMNPLQPEVIDPEPYLEQAAALASQQFTLIGYDPMRDERITWATDRDTFTSWLEAKTDGLGLREDVFHDFLQAQNATLNPEPDGVRYLEPTETMGNVEEAIREGKTSVNLRIRYRPTRYEVVSGDTGYRIARRLGVPFYALTNANPGLDWDRLTPGMTINLPSRDITLPLEPVAEKRIIVNLDTQSLVAYENGREVFRWLISSGTSSFPTYPGVYQILSHSEKALGSTFELCGQSGCGQWEMYWFMGIYEVVPGLMNGFHGAVRLPNGAYLGGGNVGYPYTYGCVMSENSNAEKLYHWAEAGTIVEIISSEYAPQSELARAWLAQGGRA